MGCERRCLRDLRLREIPVNMESGCFECTFIIFILSQSSWCIFNEPFWEKGKLRGRPLNPGRGGPLHSLSLTAPLTLHYGTYEYSRHGRTLTQMPVTQGDLRHDGSAISYCIALVNERVGFAILHL